MLKKNFLNLLISSLVSGIILLFPAGVFAWDKKYSDTVADYLGEYGVSQYKNGSIADAIHELKKCLLAEPHNEACKNELRKIFAGPFRLAWPTTVCKGQMVVFDTADSYGQLINNPTYVWDFGDGTSFEGARFSKSYDKPGIYMVKLTVNDSKGGPFSVNEALIKIIVLGPSEVDAGADVEVCCDERTDYTVNFLADPNKADTGKRVYFWDFGDGSSAKGRSVRHTYKRAGNYIARVMVRDKGAIQCSAAEDSLAVRLKTPVEARAGEDKFAYVGEEVVFDGSGSKARGNTEFIWDFGDGTPEASGFKVRHIYKNGGKYNVRLKLNDLDKAACSASEDNISAIIKSGPTAVLLKVPAACVGKEAWFDASSSLHPQGLPLSFVWDFGDGSLIRGESRISHVYKESGEYIAKVIVDDQKAGPISRSMAQTKVRVNGAPSAVIRSRDVFCISEPVVLSAADSTDPDNDSLRYYWDFQDGYTFSGVEASHIYKNPGEYIVQLLVDDGSGCLSASAQKRVKVTPMAALKMAQDELRVCVPANSDYRVFLDLGKLAFTNLSNYQCYWDLGDGTQAEGKIVAHTYQKGGRYEVRLMVDDGLGLPCSSAIGKFTLWLNKPPVVMLVPLRGCCVNEEYDFDASASFDPENDNLTFVWDFGDQSKGEGARVKHAYRKGADYTVKLTVNDGTVFGCGSTDAYLKVHVNEMPVADFKVRSD